MIADTNKFFLHDRWFYFKKELDGLRTYTTMIDDPNNGLILIYDRESNEVEIIAIKDEEFIAKLYISDITQPEISFHYKENTPQNIYIEDDLYVNLLLEAFVETKYGRIDKESLIRITRKKNLDKILYLTPPLPLDEDIYLDKYKIESEMLTYFLELINSFNIFIKLLEKDKEIKQKKLEEEKPDLSEYKIECDGEEKIIVKPLEEFITNLEIPDELYIYDRKYNFVNKDLSSINYLNTQGGENKLRVKLDPNTQIVTGMTLESRNEKDESFIFTALCGDNNIMVSFGTLQKVPLQITYNERINTNITFEGTYDKKAKPIDVLVKIEKNNTLVQLIPHPYFSGVYVDQSGNEYRLNSQEFSRFSGIASFSPYILDHIEKTLTKKK